MLLINYATLTISTPRNCLEQQAVNLLNRLVAPAIRKVAIKTPYNTETPFFLPQNHDFEEVRTTINTTPDFFQRPISEQVILIRHWATYLSLSYNLENPQTALFFKKFWNLHANQSSTLPALQTIPDQIIYQQSTLLTIEETTCPICRQIFLMNLCGTNALYSLLHASKQPKKLCYCAAHQNPNTQSELMHAIENNDFSQVTTLDNQNINMIDRLPDPSKVK